MNLGSVLKQEISRVARKEIRNEVQALKKASAQYRSDIAALKRRVADLEKMVKQLSKVTGGKSVVKASTETAGTIRFSAKGFAALRKKLGLSSAQMGVLIGVSDQSVYKYEKGEVQPRPATVVAIAGLRGLGKRAVAARLTGGE